MNKKQIALSLFVVIMFLSSFLMVGSNTITTSTTSIAPQNTYTGIAYINASVLSYKNIAKIEQNCSTNATIINRTNQYLIVKFDNISQIKDCKPLVMANINIKEPVKINILGITGYIGSTIAYLKNSNNTVFIPYNKSNITIELIANVTSNGSIENYKISYLG